MSRFVFLLCALFLVSGVLMSRHWESVYVLLGITEGDDALALRLAKTDCSFERHRINEVVIKDHLERTGGIDVIGWQVEKKAEDIYLVEFLFSQHENPGRFAFEVDVGTEFVRDVGGDPALAKKYGVTPTKPRLTKPPE